MCSIRCQASCVSPFRIVVYEKHKPLKSDIGKITLLRDHAPKNRNITTTLFSISGNNPPRRFSFSIDGFKSTSRSAAPGRGRFDDDAVFASDDDLASGSEVAIG